MINKKKRFLITEKLDMFFICFKRMKKIFFLRREFHSLFKFMQHELNKTNRNTIMFNLFLYFKI